MGGLACQSVGHSMKEMMQEYLKSVLLYDPLLGTWTWLYRPTASPQWNGHFAGKPAGGLDPDTGYLRIRIGNKLLYAHRLAFLYMLGKWPDNEGEHKNLDRSDCRWENLRDATHAENNANKGKQANNTSGYKGVSFDKKSGKWVSEFRTKGRRFRKFGFASAELAYEQYKRDVFENGCKFARVA